MEQESFLSQQRYMWFPERDCSLITVSLINGVWITSEVLRFQRESTEEESRHGKLEVGDNSNKFKP